MKNVALFGAGRIGRIDASNLAAWPGVMVRYLCDPVAAAAQDLADAATERAKSGQPVTP